MGVTGSEYGWGVKWARDKAGKMELYVRGRNGSIYTPPIRGQHLPNLAVWYISVRSYVTGYTLEMLFYLHVVYLAMLSDYDRRKVQMESTLMCTEAFVA